MPPTDLAPHARWQLEVCNACRYCESYCAVFPALERRRAFTAADLQYLANLCHDCSACYYACMYAPPHEFAVNLPRLLSEARRQTYASYPPPRLLARAAQRGFGFAAAAAALGLLVFLALVALSGDPARVFAAHDGPGAFYAVVPYLAMAVPALLLTLFGLAALARGVVSFSRDTSGSPRNLLEPRALAEAAWEALSLRYLRGGEAGGCFYPGERVSRARRVLHMLVFWGFVAAFVATLAAFVQQDLLGWLPPYPLLSVPVLLGSAGGLALILGTSGLLVLQARSDPAPADRAHRALNAAFLVELDAVAITGMLLLALRDTPAMGTLLLVHLAAIVALYVTAPYTRFAHAAYRFAALLQNRVESRQQR